MRKWRYEEKYFGFKMEAFDRVHGKGKNQNMPFQVKVTVEWLAGQDNRRLTGEKRPQK
ncbi:MAG: hypothetical protein H0A75_07610 [Candidatus Methanofishera endochildressiae]|uniref:Uncharacterized protein n=1 Tax=Candidatus Methanofishera endochildressiae TaxID=2738884 RepID=A0A7Z0MPS6_9GAMM|nr:hypothetical protein [Candidatus Methanofishera endochildressiae]